MQTRVNLKERFVKIILVFAVWSQFSYAGEIVSLKGVGVKYENIHRDGIGAVSTVVGHQEYGNTKNYKVNLVLQKKLLYGEPIILNGIIGFDLVDHKGKHYAVENISIDTDTPNCAYSAIVDQCAISVSGDVPSDVEYSSYVVRLGLVYMKYSDYDTLNFEGEIPELKILRSEETLKPKNGIYTFELVNSSIYEIEICRILLENKVISILTNNLKNKILSPQESLKIAFELGCNAPHAKANREFIFVKYKLKTRHDVFTEKEILICLEVVYNKGLMDSFMRFVHLKDDL